MGWRFCALMVMGLGLAASATDADARWNGSENCRAVLEGAATGKGILGLGSERAREAARDNWEAAAEDQYGRAYSNLDRARNNGPTALCRVVFSVSLCSTAFWMLDAHSQGLDP